MTEPNASTEVSALIHRWADGTRRGDLAQVMACYTDNVVAFDAIAALQFRGADAYRVHWQTCIEHMHGGEMVMEVHHLEVETSGTVAFAHYLARCGGCDESGEEQVGWMRATVCCRHTPDGWRIAHEHYSVPFDPETMQAMVEATP